MTSSSHPTPNTSSDKVRIERSFARFTRGQRWEHWLLLLSITVLVLTGLPQKYRASSWSQYILATPERLALLRSIHHIAAIMLILEVVYHLGHGLVLLAQRRLSADMFPTWQDVNDAGGMIKYLLFLSKSKPKFGKYNFEQKFTYWFVFVSIGIMLVTGLILWFPVFFTRFLPGGIVPAAKLAHSSEAIAILVFIVLWHFYHVHIERLNLSIFTGKLSEEEMREHHQLQHQKLTGEDALPTDESESA